MRRTLAVLALLATAGCAQSDKTEWVTFTDQHGRVCTALVVKDGSWADGDREGVALDCEYPPATVTPGAQTHRPLPG